MKDLPLASEFPQPSRAEWRKLAEQALEGASFDEALVTRLYEGIALQPLYTREDAQHSGAAPNAPSFIRGGGREPGARPWPVIQLADHADIKEANRQIKDDVANGADALWLQLGGNIPYGGGQLGARTLDELDRVFQGVHLDNLPVYISGGYGALAGCAMLVELAARRGTGPARLKGSAGLDPLSLAAASGYVPAEPDTILSDAVDAAFYLHEKGYALKPFLASGRAWHQAGGSAVHELAYTLAAAIAYWRALAAAGMPLGEAASTIELCLTADADMFLTMAKFRAARALWARATEAAGIEPQPVTVIAEMSYLMVTERDPYMNLLRGAAAAFGAGLGGADAVLLLPFNTRSGALDGFGRRLARNTQLILQEEAHLGRVADAPGGSWFIDSLTHQLAAAAWNEFRAVEAAGGLFSALEQGLTGRTLLAARAARERNLAHGRDKIIGVTAFPNLDEKPLPGGMTAPGEGGGDSGEDDEIASLPPAGNGRRFAALINAMHAGATMQAAGRALQTVYERVSAMPLTHEHAAGPFERLRKMSDQALQRVGARPPIFLANLGEPRDFGARSLWARRFFAAGGIEALDNAGFSSIEDLAQGFRQSPAPLACLCSSNRLYRETIGAARALKEAGALAVLLAATPSVLKTLPASEKRWIGRIIYDGCDMLSILAEIHQVMRVEEMSAADYEDYGKEDDLGDYDSQGGPNGRFI